MKHLLLSNPNLTRMPLLVPFWPFSFTSSSASQAPCDLEASAQGLLHRPLPMARLPCLPTPPQTLLRPVAHDLPALPAAPGLRRQRERTAVAALGVAGRGLRPGDMPARAV